MPRRFFSRFSRQYRQKSDHPWYLKPFDFLLSHPVYFSVSRRSVSGGIAVGLFVGLLPIPGQTPLAILAALLLQINLPLAVVSLWISNPLTFVPLFYFAYRIGALLLDIPAEALPPSVSLAWVTEEVALRWRPLMYGSLIMATSVASVAYLTISAIWHILTVNRYRLRHRLKHALRSKNNQD